MFAGRRPGWVFKMGDHGLGYYRDASSAPAIAAGTAPAQPRSGGLVAYGSDDNDDDDDDDDAAAGNAAADGSSGAAAAASAALPSNFFDNPQADSRNKGREVAKTQKQQSLTDEFAEFEKQVAADLVAAEEADDAAEEDEEEAKLREAVSVARELENKLEGLRKQREAAAERLRLAQPVSTSAAAGGAAAGSGASKEAEDDEDDEDDLDESALDVLDWRAKGL